ncbi:MAG: PAS domain S-box protein [Pedobacter sp.]
MESTNSEQLLRDLIDHSTDIIQVFSAVRDEHGNIIDFIWILNNKAAKKSFGDVIGKSLLTLNPGVLEEGIFDTFKKVVESGESNQRVMHYAHEQFVGWFHQTSVKQGDGVATFTKDITQEIRAEDEIRSHRESLQAILDGSLHYIQAFKAVRDKAGRIIDFIWIFTNHLWIQHYGDVIGKKVLTENPGVIESGLYDQFVQVTETGIPVFQEKFYSHEQFQDQWFHQTLVKSGDGFIMNTEDITERKSAENEIHRLKDEILQRSEDKYRTLFNTIDEGLSVIELIYDDHGKPISMNWMETNQAFERITGLKTVDGKVSSDFSASENHWLETYDHVLKTGEPVRKEHYDNMSKRWYRTHTSRVGGGENHVLANVLEDITERKQREQRLEKEVDERTTEVKESRDQLQSILDTTLLQISVLEAARSTEGEIYNFKIKSVNKELERITGRSDLAGKLYATEFPGIKKVGIFNMIVETIETGQPQQMEYYYAHDGFTNWFSCMFVKFNDGVITTNIDITSRKRAEDERFKNYVLLQQSEDIALLGSWDFSLLEQSFTWSDGMYRLLDLEKGLNVRPEIYLEYATQNGRAAAGKLVESIINGHSDFEETLEISVSGEIKLLHIKAAVVRNDVGDAERVLGVNVDISAVYAAEEKIRKMEAEQQLEIFRVSLSTLEEERHRISESLHNGIGQILYGIMLHMSGLSQEVSLADFKENKTYISKLLTDVIKETRRISHELMPTTLEQFGLKSAILDICTQLSDATQFKCTISGLFQDMEKYMELAIYRTTQELMTNVVKHANATECMVNVDIGEQEIRIQVSDNGQGMAATRTRMPGIGLASIRSKVKLLNGNVRVDSIPEKGTNIEVVIPQALKN